MKTTEMSPEGTIIKETEIAPTNATTIKMTAGTIGATNTDPN
jgi:hypothetical protein